MAYSSPVSTQSSNWMTPSSVKRLRSQPVVAVEQAELLAVRHDLGEQDVLELLAPLVGHDEPHRVLHRHAHAVPHLLLQEPVAHADRGLERELLAVRISASVSSL